MESIEQKKARVVKIIAILKKTHPDAKLALDFTNPLELLIALILAAQCRDDLVNTVTPALFKKYKTAAEYAKANPATLQEEIHKISFFYLAPVSRSQDLCRTSAEVAGVSGEFALSFPA